MTTPLQSVSVRADDLRDLCADRVELTKQTDELEHLTAQREEARKDAGGLILQNSKLGGELLAAAQLRAHYVNGLRDLRAELLDLEQFVESAVTGHTLRNRLLRKLGKLKGKLDSIGISQTS